MGILSLLILFLDWDIIVVILGRLLSVSVLLLNAKSANNTTSLMQNSALDEQAGLAYGNENQIYFQSNIQRVMTSATQNETAGMFSRKAIHRLINQPHLREGFPVGIFVSVSQLCSSQLSLLNTMLCQVSRTEYQSKNQNPQIKGCVSTAIKIKK